MVGEGMEAGVGGGSAAFMPLQLTNGEKLNTDGAQSFAGQ
jgi:hypothetical protein